MKTYLSIDLDGNSLAKKILLPLGVCNFLVATYLLYIIYFFGWDFTDNHMRIFILLFFLCIFVTTYVTCRTIEETVSHIKYIQNFSCKYNYKLFLKMFLKDLGLWIITLGIYTPWLITNLIRFYTRGITYNTHSFRFNNNALKLLGIFLSITSAFIFFRLFIIITAIVAEVMGTDISDSFIDISSVIFLVILYMLLFLLLGQIVKWFFDFNYKNHHITYQGKVLPLAGILFIHIIFGVITFGVYAPFGFLNIYRYILKHISDENKNILIDFSGEYTEGFSVIFINGLLTILSLGLYFPWAYNNFISWLLSHTSIDIGLKY